MAYKDHYTSDAGGMAEPLSVLPAGEPAISGPASWPDAHERAIQKEDELFDDEALMARDFIVRAAGQAELDLFQALSIAFFENLPRLAKLDPGAFGKLAENHTLEIEIAQIAERARGSGVDPCEALGLASLKRNGRMHEISSPAAVMRHVGWD